MIPEFETMDNWHQAEARSIEKAQPERLRQVMEQFSCSATHAVRFVILRDEGDTERDARLFSGMSL